MSSKKIIAVTGATGSQGSGLVHAILEDKDSPFTVRALTRNRGSDKARALADLGADVVEADIADLDSVKSAFEGAYGAYCVTFYWEHMSPEKEQANATNLAKAAADAGLEHVIWSTLEDTREFIPIDDDRMPTLHGQYKVPHYDTKGSINHVFADNGVPTTYLLTSFYWDNFIYFGMGPKAGPDGKLAITFPLGDKKLPGIAAKDIGRCAYGIFKRPEEYTGKTVGIAGGHPTGQEMAEGLSKALGKAIHYNAVPPEAYRSFGFPGADDLGNMFQFKAEFEDYYTGVRNLDESRKLNPDLMSFDEWARVNKDRIPID